MPDRLLLRLDSAGDATWLRQAANGRVASSTRGLPPESVLAAAGDIVVLVPAEDVLLTEARVAARSRAQLMQALPFAIEDQLLGGVEDLQFAASEASGDTVGAAVVAKATLRGWLDRLASSGIRPDALLPDSLALPVATALIEADRATVRLAPWSAFACAPQELSAWLAHGNAAAGARSLEVRDFRDAPAPRLSITSSAYHERQHDPLAFLANALGKPPLNLLHGEFAPRHRSARGARWWRIAAAAAAAVVVLALANLVFEVAQLSRTSARLDALTQEAARKAFPDIGDAELARTSASDLVQRRIEKLRGGSQSSGLLRVLAQIAPVLGGTPRVQARGIEFRNGSLELGLLAPDVATLDAMRERLAALPGLTVAVTAANPGDGGIDGRIRIASAGGTP